MKNSLAIEINHIIDILRKCGLSADDNPAYANGSDIIWQGYQNITDVLKNRPYSEIYEQCLTSKAYTILMIDGAIIQIMYRIDNKRIAEHRLVFFPNPFVKNYGLNEETFDQNYENFEMLPTDFKLHPESPQITPVRFDFSNETKKHVIIKHPKSHMTLGGYLNCRIPVYGPISPTEFIVFILRNFYHSKLDTSLEEKIEIKAPYPNNIDLNEQNILHMSRLTPSHSVEQPSHKKKKGGKQWKKL